MNLLRSSFQKPKNNGENNTNDEKVENARQFAQMKLIKIIL